MRLPMFPLGTVLFPSMVLPLHVFEERYRQLMRDCIQGGDPGGLTRSFGVVLIERGSEVGGGDTRFGVGCVAHIEEYQEQPDGRFLLNVRGDVPLRVREWGPDDPYPTAEVDLVERGGEEVSEELLRASAMQVRTALAHQIELGLPAPPATAALSTDPGTAVWQLCARVPAGPLDRQRLLSAVDHTDRLQRVSRLAADAIELFAHRLASG